MTWVTAKWQKQLESPQGWEASGWCEDSLTWGAEHPPSLGLPRQTLPFQNPPNPRSPYRKGIGCSVGGAISTKFVLNNPLPQHDKGSKQVGRNMVLCGARLKSCVLVHTDRPPRSSCVAVLSLKKKIKNKQPGWNPANGWNPEHGWPLSALVRFESVAEQQRMQSELCCEQTQCYKILHAPQKVTCGVTSRTPVCVVHIHSVGPGYRQPHCPGALSFTAVLWDVVVLYVEPVDTVWKKKPHKKLLFFVLNAVKWCA